jgi:hypothetical protein
MTQTQRALAYLWAAEPDGAINADLARHLGTSQQTVYMLTQDLLRQGLIPGEPQGRTWRFHAGQAPAASPYMPGGAATVEVRFPHVARWVSEFGWIEIGQDDHSRSMVRALDTGGMIWEGQTHYPCLDALLGDLDCALADWFKAEMRE